MFTDRARSKNRSMRRTQIQLEELTYAELRRRAYEEGRSMSALIRETLAHAFGTRKPPPPRSLRDFSFIGAGRSRQGALSPVSERHDEALAQAVVKRHRR